MKASRRLIPLLVLATGLASAEPAASSKSHAKTLTGTIASVDTSQKTLAIRDAQGKETRLFWTGATRVMGGELQTGRSVTVRWMPHEGKKIATVVKIHPQEAETTAAAGASASLSPTPKAP